MNQELIRLCVQNQQSPQENDITPYVSVIRMHLWFASVTQDILRYQARLQSNLTYLATMADISMVKLGEVSSDYVRRVLVAHRAQPITPGTQDANTSRSVGVAAT